MKIELPQLRRSMLEKVNEMRRLEYIVASEQFKTVWELVDDNAKETAEMIILMWTSQ